MVGFIADITERRRMEKACGRARRPCDLLRQHPLAMGVVEIHGDDLRFVSTNQATADLIGMAMEDLQDR